MNFLNRVTEKNKNLDETLKTMDVGRQLTVMPVAQIATGRHSDREPIPMNIDAELEQRGRSRERQTRESSQPHHYTRTGPELNQRMHRQVISEGYGFVEFNPYARNSHDRQGTGPDTGMNWQHQGHNYQHDGFYRPQQPHTGYPQPEYPQSTYHQHINVEQQQNARQGRMSNFKTTIQPPSWEKGSSQAQRISNLNDFVANLLVFREVSPMSDCEIIYSALEKSDRMEIFRELSTQGRSHLTSFIEHLRRAHGGSAMKQRASLEDLKQGAMESPLSYYMRCIREYYLARSMIPPSRNQIQEKERQMDIKFLFTKGLKNPRVAEQVRLSSKKTDFWNLGSLANDAAEALEETQPQLMNVSVKETRSRPRCYNCGFQGHVAAECTANQMTRGRHQRRQNSKGRRSTPYPRRGSRERDFSGSRNRERSRERPYKSGRNGSRDRSKSRERGGESRYASRESNTSYKSQSTSGSRYGSRKSSRSNSRDASRPSSRDRRN